MKVVWTCSRFPRNLHVISQVSVSMKAKRAPISSTKYVFQREASVQSTHHRHNSKRRLENFEAQPMNDDLNRKRSMMPFAAIWWIGRKPQPLQSQQPRTTRKFVRSIIRRESFHEFDPQRDRTSTVADGLASAYRDFRSKCAHHHQLKTCKHTQKRLAKTCDIQ